MLEPFKYDEVMNTLDKTKRVQLISVLVEGNSLRATSRICDVAFNTVLKFIPQIGMACADYQDKVFHDLKCKRIQCDEIWSFAMQSRRMFQRISAGSSAMGIYGRGLRWMQSQNLCLHSW